jgi:WD40 repeat protein
MKNKQQTLTLPPRSGTITEMAWSTDGKKLAAVTDRGWLFVWYIRTGTPILRRHLGRTHLRTVAWSPNGRALVVGGENGTLYRLSRLTTDPIVTFDLFPASLSRLSWSSSPLGRCLVVSGSRLTLFGAGTQAHVEYPAPILDAAWGPDGRLLAVVCANGLLDVWDAEERRSRFACTDLANPSCLGWHSDGRLAIGTTDGQMVVYDPRQGVLCEQAALATFPLHALAWGERYVQALDKVRQLQLLRGPETLTLASTPTFVLHPQGNQLATAMPGKVALVTL